MIGTASTMALKTIKCLWAPKETRIWMTPMSQTKESSKSTTTAITEISQLTNSNSSKWIWITTNSNCRSRKAAYMGCRLMISTLHRTKPKSPACNHSDRDWWRMAVGSNTSWTWTTRSIKLASISWPIPKVGDRTEATKATEATPANIKSKRNPYRPIWSLRAPCRTRQFWIRLEARRICSRRKARSRKGPGITSFYRAWKR